MELLQAKIATLNNKDEALSQQMEEQAPLATNLQVQACTPYDKHVPLQSAPIACDL